jgi:hypothetical protein
MLEDARSDFAKGKTALVVTTPIQATIHELIRAMYCRFNYVAGWTAQAHLRALRRYIALYDLPYSSCQRYVTGYRTVIYAMQFREPDRLLELWRLADTGTQQLATHQMSIRHSMSSQKSLTMRTYGIVRCLFTGSTSWGLAGTRTLVGCCQASGTT